MSCTWPVCCVVMFWSQKTLLSVNIVRSISCKASLLAFIHFAVMLSVVCVCVYVCLFGILTKTYSSSTDRSNSLLAVCGKALHLVDGRVGTRCRCWFNDT